MDRAQLPIELALDALDGADADMMLGGELADAGAALLQGVPDFALDRDRDRWPAETLALGAQDQPADKRSEAFLDGLPQACGNLGRSPVSLSVALRGEIHRGPEYVAARLARPDMPDAAVVDMLRPYRRCRIERKVSRSSTRFRRQNRTMHFPPDVDPLMGPVCENMINRQAVF